MPKTLRLGTRRSLLAWAQSSWVASEIGRLNPGVRVELVGIDTRGDRIQDVPLQAVQGKEFFVAELDDALRSGAVDLSVHSMKDLSLDRPAEFVTAAVPKRENPRDVALFGPGIQEKIRSGRKLRIGTSSPRRIENIPAFLAQALPARPDGSRAEVEFVEIRGNVNTRLSRVLESIEHPKYLDGVILAFAGLIRLWADAKAREEARTLLNDIRWMVLPLRECAAASAQGALAVECRASDAETRAAIAKLHYPETERHASMERALLREWGGGCHQRFGATAIRHPELGDLLYVKGVKPDGSRADAFEWRAPARPAEARPSWNGYEWRARGIQGASPASRVPELDGRAVFVGHARAVPESWPASAFADARVWTSGTASWFKLAARGIWIEGCAENLGFESVLATLGEGVLQLPPFREWKVLTHADAVDTWRDEHRPEEVLVTYENLPLEGEALAEARDALRSARQIWWGSGSQFDQFKNAVSSGARHACGAGKTAAHLRANGIEPLVFPSIEEWKRWLNTASH